MGTLIEKRILTREVARFSFLEGVRRMVKILALVFGAVLLAIWGILTLQASRRRLPNPTTLSSLQDNLIIVIEGTSIRTALLTAGLLSIALSLT